MSKKHVSRSSRSDRRKTVLNLISVPLFVLFAFFSIKLGIFAGDYISKVDSGFIKSIDVNNFKLTLNKSAPLIETVYNSGKVDVSIIGELQNLMRYIFEFDLNTPMTILNAQSTVFYSYYHKSYLPLMAQQEAESRLEDEIREDPGVIVADNNEVPEENDPGPELPHVESSISYDGENDEKDLSKSDIVSSGKIVVQNETKFKVDESEISRLLKEPLKIKYDRKGPKVLIFHTHTTESYIKNLADLNKKNVPNWSRDPRENVVRVGDELAQLLKKKYAIDVLHNGTTHDYPYKSSYSNAYKTIGKYLKSYPSIKMFLDIHRDGLEKGGQKLRVVTKINGKSTARIMFVVGTNGTGLKHPNWKENLKLAIKLQDYLNRKYPGLSKPIYISKNRYNQHVSNGSLIIEVGGDGNTMAESLESVKYLAEAINEVIK